MRHLITDLYAANGFFGNDHKSWVINDGIKRKYPKKPPTMDDACRYAFAKLKRTIIGGDTRSGRALEELNKVTTIAIVFPNSKASLERHLITILWKKP